MFSHLPYRNAEDLDGNPREDNWRFDITREYKKGDWYSQNKPDGLYLSNESNGNGWSNHRMVDGDTEIVYTIYIDASKLLTISRPSDIPKKLHTMNDFGERKVSWEKIRKAGYTGILIERHDPNKCEDHEWFRTWDCDAACIWDLSIVKIIENPEGERVYQNI